MTKTTVKAPAPKTSSAHNSKPHQAKKVQLTSLLTGKRLYALADLSRRFGWQPHSTRAALSGLRKDGANIETVKGGCRDGKTGYRIAPKVISKPHGKSTTKS